LLGLGYVAITTTFGNKGVVVSFLFCLFVVVFSFERGFLSAILKMRGFAYLGKISFSVYMVHAPIIFCVISCAMIGSKLLGVDLTMMSSYQDGDSIKYISTGSIFVDGEFKFEVQQLVKCSF
jgi:peptidoglycan/LPS O-acetylase OafA/YrhL